MGKDSKVKGAPASGAWASKEEWRFWLIQPGGIIAPIPAAPFFLRQFRSLRCRSAARLCGAALTPASPSCLCRRSSGPGRRHGGVQQRQCRRLGSHTVPEGWRYTFRRGRSHQLPTPALSPGRRACQRRTIPIPDKVIGLATGEEMTQALMGKRWRLCSSPVPRFSLAKRGSIMDRFLGSSLSTRGRGEAPAPAN